MPYITIKKHANTHQITFEELLMDMVPDSAFINKDTITSNTVTFYKKEIDPRVIAGYDIVDMRNRLQKWIDYNSGLFAVPESERKERLYYTFHIPKKSGGLREINAPNDELMTALRDLKTILEGFCIATRGKSYGCEPKYVPVTTYHTNAYAYIPHRCTRDAVVRHQRNESKWFLKMDFSNFFGSVTIDFLMSMLTKVFPYSYVAAPDDGALLRKAIGLCFLDGGLPQGTPISPWLTNVMMIPIDHMIAKDFRTNNVLGNKKGVRNKCFIYTRYADDIFISSKWQFSYRLVEKYINEILKRFGAPFLIKPEKTTYGSSAGSNWILGLMLNGDNKITVGHRQKKRLRAMINNFIRDYKSGVAWDYHDVQVLGGHIQYYKSIEPEYVNSVIERSNNEHNVNVENMIKTYYADVVRTNQNN